MSLYPPPNLITALNGHAGITRLVLRGRNPAISTSAETVWNAGATYAKLTAATPLEVVSSSANDTANGTGARTVVVRGVDSSYLPITETVTLNGTTPVALTAVTHLAVNRFYVATVGSGGVNAGNIDVRAVTGSVVVSRIASAVQLGQGRASDFIFTVPDEYTAVIGDIHFSATGVTGDLSVYLNSSDENGVLTCLGAGKSSLYVTAFNGARGAIHFGSGLVVPEKTLIELRCIASAGAGDLVAQAEIFLVNKSKALWGKGEPHALL